jgi:hypothetical protein
MLIARAAEEPVNLSKWQRSDEKIINCMGEVRKRDWF